MTGSEIVAKVKSLKLPKGSYIVFGSCPMAVANIREANDVDLLVSNIALDIIKKDGWKQVSKGKDDKPYTKDLFEAHTSWSFSSYKPTLKHLLATANFIDGILFASLEEVRKWKEASGRPKDLVDVKLIDSYLANDLKTKGKATITICSSANFYKQAVDCRAALEGLGYKVIIPATAERMKLSGDFDVSHYKTWFGDSNDYHKKTALMKGHFNEVSNGDAILVLNYEKHGVANYIGGNVLMEMALAFFLGKPIFILNEIPDKSAFLEEIIGLNPIVLSGRVDKLPTFNILSIANQ
ncbi:MAG TPA: hypothetical protein VGF75_07620 [Candidatus Saccharimonadales bacterium]|jgi:hypothetical protein